MSLAPDYTAEAEEIVRLARYAQGIDRLVVNMVANKLAAAFAAGGCKALDLVKHGFDRPQRGN